MSNQEPDGWAIFDKDAKDFAGDFYLDKQSAELDYGESTNYDIKPVMLISPQELLRLRAIEEAVKPFVDIVKHSVGRIPVEKLSFSDWHELCKAATAITAPVEGMRPEPLQPSPLSEDEKELLADEDYEP